MAQTLAPEPIAPPASADDSPPVARSRHDRPALRLALEMVMIGLGVFLGLAGDQWRESAEHRQAARTALRQFRAEIVANRQAVTAVGEYRATTLAALRAYLAVPHNVRNTADVHLRGLQSIHFEETAWDLALATQSLNYMDPTIAADLSRVYGAQRRITELNGGMIRAMYLLPWREDFDGFANAAETYFADLVIMEPKLVAMYDDVLPRIDRVLGDGASR